MNRLIILIFAIISALVPISASADTRGSYFAVIVSDIDKSVAWYESNLGLKAGARLSEDGKYEIVNLRSSDLFVELLQLSAAADRPEGMIKGPFKVGFLVGDLKYFVSMLPGSLDPPEIMADDKNALLMIQLKDPDGNTVQVMELIAD